MPPPSDVVLALRGAVVYEYLIEVSDNSSDDDSLFTIEGYSGTGDNDLSNSIKVDGDSSDEDSVDQQTLEPQFHQVSGCRAYK